MPWARASALHRHLVCPSASWFPRTDHGVWSPGYLDSSADLAQLPSVVDDSSAADWGTEMHEAKAGHGQDPWVTAMEPHRGVLWPSTLGRHEVCVAYDCSTREAIVGPADLPKQEQDAWKASQSDDCVVGVSDWLGELSDEAWVDDLKTGWKRPDPASVQLLFYLMVWAKSRGDKQGWTSVTWWPRGTDYPTRSGLWRKVTALAFDSLEDDIHQAWLRATRIKPVRPVPGPQCSYCPSALVCPRAFE